MQNPVTLRSSGALEGTAARHNRDVVEPLPRITKTLAPLPRKRPTTLFIARLRRPRPERHLLVERATAVAPPPGACSDATAMNALSRRRRTGDTTTRDQV